MKVATDSQLTAASIRQGGFWGHLLVSASACLLTVSILGSAVILAYKGYRRHELKAKVRSFIASLENRTPEELAERTEELRQRPKVAQHVLPELRNTLAAARSENQLRAAIEVSRAFVSHSSIRRALLELRRDPRETVAAAAISVLADLEPPEKAAEALGQCLEGVDVGEISDTAVDEICAGLLKLGGPGLEVMQRHVGRLSEDRRIWIVGYVDAVGGPYRRAWLDMLLRDPDPRVSAAARAAQDVRTVNAR